MHEHKMGQVESHNVIKATQSATYIVKLKGFSLMSGISPQTYQVHPRLIQHLNSLNPNRSQASQFFPLPPDAVITTFKQYTSTYGVN